VLTIRTDDFPKPAGAKWRSVTTTHAALAEFVKRYFVSRLCLSDAESTNDLIRCQDERIPESSKEETRNRSAFDLIMSNSILQSAEGAVDISAKLPLILQVRICDRNLAYQPALSDGYS
jgi:hypothetical protein